MSCCSPTPAADCCSTAQATRTEQSDRAVPKRRPTVDIFETHDELVAIADVPGARADGVNVSFDDGVLTIRAAVPVRETVARQIGDEFTPGDFERSFELGTRIDPARISATLAHGVLTLRMPKADSVKPRKIEIKQA